MANPPEPPDPPSSADNNAPVPDEVILTELIVEGTLPTPLSGRYVRIGPNPVGPATTPASRRSDGMVHAVELHEGSAVRYRNRWVTTDHIAATLGTDPVPGPPATRSDVVATNLITFGGRTLALGPGALAYELDRQLATVGRVDLAGHGRGIGAHPQVDPTTGALHLVSHGDEPAHHVIAPNSQTRITTSVGGAPGPLQDLLLTRDRLVLFGNGFAGVTDRTGQVAPRWADADLCDTVTERDVPGVVVAHDLDDAVTVLTSSRSLRRWTLDRTGARCDVLDDTPQRFGTTNATSSVPRFLWTVAALGGTVVYRHDLRRGERTDHDLGLGRHPGELTFVPDPARPGREDGGWLVGFVHDDTRDEAELVVLDAAAVDRPAIATVRIPRRVPYGLHGTWIPEAPAPQLV
jgi:carotenoid cleavage dioxygenase